MISINRLAQAKKNLEQDLKHVYETCYNYSLDSFSFLLGEDRILEGFISEDEFLRLCDKTEKEILVFLVEKNCPEFSEDERERYVLEKEKEANENGYWKRTLRVSYLSERYYKALSKTYATAYTVLYDTIVHLCLFSNWRWKTEELDLNTLDMSLSPKEISDKIFDLNPDLVSVLISKLEDCPIAVRESLQSAFESGQREVFIEHLKGLSILDYNGFVFIISLFCIEDVFMSPDIENIEILINHIDFENYNKYFNDTSLKAIIRDAKALDTKYSFLYEDDTNTSVSLERYESILDFSRDSCALLIKQSLLCFELIKPKPFLFEKQYIDNLLNDPDVKAILPELPEKPNEDAAPDVQEQPKPQPTIAPTEGQEPEVPPKQEKNRKTPGREPEKWFKRACTEEEFGQIIKKNIWPYLRDELRRFNYGIDKERAKVKFNDAVKTSAAALIVYCSDKIGLTTTSPVSSFSKSMERTFAFLPAPRTTASLYLKRLATWYEKLKDASKERVKDEKTGKTLAKWKQEDSVRGTFIVENTYNLKILIENNIPHLLAKYFDVKTDIVYKEMGTSFDKALYKPVEHKDNIKKNENGHQQKTGMGMSDGSDKD